MFVFDFQTQILPDRFSRTLPDAARKWGKFWSKPISRSIHEMQPWLRFLPPIGRAVIEELGAIAPISHLAFESSIEDLKDSMEENKIDRAVILSDPWRVANEELIQITNGDDRFVAAIRLPPKPVAGTAEVADARHLIASAHESGVRILQIHPSADGVDPKGPAYETQLEAAAERGWIILLQTGAPKAHLVYRRPEASSVGFFEPWISRYPKTPFVLARMNFSDPEEAIDLAERFSNVHLETSWQPTETIAEAVRRIGAERILFGSDWPILGNNQKIGISRIRDARDSQMITNDEAAKILGENANRLMEAAKGSSR